jgi:Xaa-Pro aminopeptidase
MLLQTSGCRSRQARLREWMKEQKVDVAVVTWPRHVYYLTGALQQFNFPMAAVVWADGEVVLIDHGEREETAADTVMRFDPQALATIKPALPAMVGTEVGKSLSGKSPSKAAVEFEYGYPCVTEQLNCEIVPLDDQFRAMRRRKDPDEVAVIKRLIEVGNAGYAAAKELMVPGQDELVIYEAIHAAMVYEAGEEVTWIGNDFRCADPGGLPRKGHKTQLGEIAIFDMGPQHWSYCADSCRSFSIGGEPSDEQLKAWRHNVEALRIVEETVKPGASARELYLTVKAHEDEYAKDAFFHHLGHGIGLDVHEAPRLNPNFDDVFVEGDVITAEPGLYTDELRAGMRLEHNYLVTKGGVEKLTPFPLELV